MVYIKYGINVLYKALHGLKTKSMIRNGFLWYEMAKYGMLRCDSIVLSSTIY